MVNPQQAPGNPRHKQRGENYFVPTVNPYNRSRAPTSADIKDPATGRLYPIHCEWRDNGGDPARNDIWKLVDIANNLADWELITSGTGDVVELTGDDGNAIEPSAGNINVLGEVVANSTHVKPLYTQEGATSNTLDIELQVGTAITGAPGNKNDCGLACFDDDYFTVDSDGYVSQTQAGIDTAMANFIVDPTGLKAEYTTITDAIAAASSGDIIGIKKGTYTENITIDKNLTFVSLENLLRGSNGPAIFTGNITFSNVTQVTFSGFEFNHSGGTLFDNDQNNSAISFVNSKFNFAFDGITGFTHTASNANTYFQNCYINISATTAKLCDLSGASSVTWFQDCFFEASATNTPSTISAGSIRIWNSIGTIAWSASGSSVIYIWNHETVIGNGVQNKTYFTLSGTSQLAVKDSYLGSGTETAISIGTGCTASVYNTIINSSNTNVIDGAGTLNYAGLTFTGTSSAINVTTQTVGTESPSRTIGSTNIGGSNNFRLFNSDNTDSSSNSVYLIDVGGANGGDPFIRYNIPGIKVWNHGIDNSDSDKFKLTMGPGGPSSSLIIQEWEEAGTTISPVNVGGTNAVYVLNSDDTDTSSHARFRIGTQASGGDPYLSWEIGGVQGYSSGIDQSDSNIWKLTNNPAGVSVGTTLLQVTNTGNATFPGTGALTVNTGTTAQRPGTPVNGMIRYDTDLGRIEGYSGGSWKDLSAGAGSGDVVGPGSSTDNALTRFDGATGKLIQNSTATLSDAGVLSTAELTLTTALDETYGGTGQTSFTTGDILYASASNTLSKLGSGSDGEVLTLASGVPSWASAGGSSPLTTDGDLYTYDSGDARLPIGTIPGDELIVNDSGVVQWDTDVIVIKEDFFNINQGGWFNAKSSSGAVKQIADPGGHPGIISLSVSAVSDDSAYINSSPSYVDALLIGNGVLRFDFLVKIPTLNDGSDDFTLKIGLGEENAFSSSNDYVFFIYNTVIGTDWIPQVASSGVGTTASGGSTVAVDTDWTHLRIDINAGATQVDFYIDGVNAGSCTTNIPSVALSPELKITKTVGSNERELYIDAYRFYNKLTNSRWV